MKASKSLIFNLLFGVMMAVFAVTLFVVLPPTGAHAKKPTEVKSLPVDELVAPAPEVDTMQSSDDSTDTTTPPPMDDGGSGGGDSKNLFAVVWSWLLANKEAAIGLLLLVLDALVRLTPTEKDNNLLRLVQSWIDKLIPNYRKGGGKFAAFKEPDDAPALAAVVKS
jgi:hypothetical protein